MTSLDIKKEVDKELIKKGHKALIDALGPAGALAFLQAENDLERSSEDSDGIKRILLEVYIDADEIVMNFSTPVTWMRFSPDDAIGVAKDIIEKANKISKS